METPQNQRGVAQLSGARLPADHGLSSLGLLMQLVGSFFLGYMALLALLPIFAGGAPGSWQLFLLGASGAVRSAFHRNAGSALLYGSATGPLRAVRTYAWVGLAETALWVLVLTKSQFGLSMELTLPIAGMLAAWPITLLIVASRPSIKAIAEDEVPQSEDMGFEGAAVLMSILGVMGALLSGVVVYALLKAQIWSSSGGVIGVLFLGVFIMLLVRSVFHARAGIQGTTGLDADGASESAAKYYSFGVVSSVVVGGALLVQMMMSTIHPISLLMVGVVVFWLLIWPLALRRFYTERNFSVLLAGSEAPNYRRSPDAGMTALGWLLVMMGGYQLGNLLPSVLLGDGGNALGGALAGLGSGMSPADMAEAAGRSMWWNVGLGAVQLWAGIELVRMTDRYRLAANIYGVVGSAVTVYVYWPMLEGMSGAFGRLGGGAGAMFEAFGFSMLAIFLVIPVAAVLLANRKLTPQATARIAE